MSESDTHGSDVHDERKMSWKERETALALERLANARANLSALEEQQGGPDPLAGADPADLTRLDELQAEITALTPKTKGRFGAAAARERVDELELQSRLILERLGLASYDDVVAARNRPATPGVDPIVLDFARREVADAEQAFIEIVSLELPPVEPEEGLDEEADGEVAEVVDLRMRGTA